MFCGAHAVNISLQGRDGSTALLTIESESLRGEAACEPALVDRFERIVTGLSRQLRSTIERDVENGRYSLAIPVIDKAES